MTRAAGAVKYNLGDNYPKHLLPIALIEVDPSTNPPNDVVLWDVTYYASTDLIPASLYPIAAHMYSLTDSIPAFLKKVATFLKLIPITDGKSLKFSDKTNSVHLLTAGV